MVISTPGKSRVKLFLLTAVRSLSYIAFLSFDYSGTTLYRYYNREYNAVVAASRSDTDRKRWPERQRRARKRLSRRHSVRVCVYIASSLLHI